MKAAISLAGPWFKLKSKPQKEHWNYSLLKLIVKITSNTSCNVPLINVLKATWKKSLTTANRVIIANKETNLWDGRMYEQRGIKNVHESWENMKSKEHKSCKEIEVEKISCFIFLIPCYEKRWWIVFREIRPKQGKKELCTLSIVTVKKKKESKSISSDIQNFL